MTTVLIAGATGLIGRQLSNKLLAKGYQVAILSRSKKQLEGIKVFEWDIANNKIPDEAISTADFIINLAGENIGEKRWNKARRDAIIGSRIDTTQLLFNKFSEIPNQLQAYVSASAIGYYGAYTSDKIYTETDTAANDFLGQTCLQWETAADKFNGVGIRTVKIRTGIVLSNRGGVLQKMLPLINLGLGSALGSGKQYMPWIHIDDLCNIYIKAIGDRNMNGAYNAVSPHHITNKEFTLALAKLLRKPFWLPNVPSFLLKLVFGKMSAMLLQGSRVSSEKLINVGYKFQFTKLSSALKDLLISK